MSEARNSKELARLACEALEEKKAEDIRVISIEKISTLADYFLIASGNNRNQVQAMADNVEETLGREGIHPRQIEGYQNANWILMDYGDLVIHVFDQENRLFYDLERIWRDGQLMERAQLDQYKIILCAKKLPRNLSWQKLRNGFCGSFFFLFQIHN